MTVPRDPSPGALAGPRPAPSRSYGAAEDGVDPGWKTPGRDESTVAVPARGEVAAP